MNSAAWVGVAEEDGEVGMVHRKKDIKYQRDALKTNNTGHMKGW